MAYSTTGCSKRPKMRLHSCPMLLTVDVGNTNTVFGVFEKGKSAPIAFWRLETREGRTGDEYAALLQGFFTLSGLPWGKIDAAIMATVVPPVMFALEELFSKHLKCAQMI